MNRKLSAQSRDTLFHPRFDIKAPNAFDLGAERWIHCVPILSLDVRGRIEIACPTYNTKPSFEDDLEAERALHELRALLELHVVDVYLAPGQWIVWNNSAIVHRRGAIGDGPRDLRRSYIRRDCDAMREALGRSGPIFSAKALLATSGIIPGVLRDVA